MMRALILLLALFVAVTPAAAHKLKVFATVEGDAVKGYAFFVGGGRAQQVSWVAKGADGRAIANGATDDEGRFNFAIPPPPVPDITITVDTHEGHIASATLPAARFDGAAALTPPGPAVADAQGSSPAPTAATPAAAAGLTPQQTAALVDAAVQRQVEPLMEQIEAMDSRLRFTDVISGVFLILGLAGMGLWANGRRK